MCATIPEFIQTLYKTCSPEFHCPRVFETICFISVLPKVTISLKVLVKSIDFHFSK